MHTIFAVIVALAATTAPAIAAEITQCKALGLTDCPQPFDAVLPAAADMLVWDQRSRVIGFRNTYRLYKGDVFHTLGGEVYPLPAAARKLPLVQYRLDGHAYGLRDYLERQSVAGLLILKDGRIAYEYYGEGNGDTTLWTSRSVAKSVVSILVGIAVKEGLIRSMADPVTRYLPEFAGSAWEGVTLRDLLQHTSGVAWNEHYADPNSDFARLTRCEASENPSPCISHLIGTLKRVPGLKPGEQWSYNTGGAWLVGRVLEQASGVTIAKFLESRLWSRFAMERDGVWQALVPGQMDMGGHGFNATLRDWGRFALFAAGGGRLAGGEQLLPTDWITQSVTWTKARGSVTPATPNGMFGYQWWSSSIDPGRADEATARIARDTFWAEGIYGQAIAIDPAERLVMVQWSTWKQADAPGSHYEEQGLMFSALARALKSARSSD